MEKNESSISGDESSRPWQSYNTVYTTAKAGMEGVDKDKVQRIVYEMSKGSKYFENEERKEVYMKQKMDSMRAQLANLTALDISHHQKIVDKRFVELEATRDLSRIWLHVDMDAFYAAVETLSNPSLKGKPMAVGGMSMISTANYEARKFGVRAAMPGFIARKLCPELILVPTDFKKYIHYSDLTRKGFFQEYDPNFLAASLDEAYLDITSFCNDKGMTAGEVAEELRETVFKETGLTCSVGIGPNRLLAKVCSDINKPNGQFVLPNERMAVMAFISTLPIRKIGGIGKVTENILNGVFGITTCEELLHKSSFICALFSRSSADFFLSVGLGLGRTGTPQVTQRKSMSNERTFSPTEDAASLYQKLVDLSENLSSDLKKHSLRGKTVTLKLKTSCFEVRTRAVTLPNYICSGEDILKHASRLLKAELPVSLRLMGLRMSHFDGGREGNPKQMTLSKFIITESASGRGHKEDEALSESNLIDDDLSSRRETDFYSDTDDPCESSDLVDMYQVTDLDHREASTLHINVENVDNLDMAIDTENMLPTGAFQLEKVNSSLGVSGEESTMNSWTGPSDEPRATTQRMQNEAVFWLHDYECSVCGIEMPPSFVEERREHFDFHLAERLQEEESSNVNRIIKPKQRFIEITRGRQKKKQKVSPSEGKHVNIDMFFTKTSQEF